jgi:O-antigen/teichoic acid export membrane protein
MQQQTFANRVMYDGLYTFVMRILNMVGAAGLGILTARLLGPAGKGLYALPAVESGLVVTAFAGLNSAFSYFMLNRKPGRRILIPAFITAGIYVVAGEIALIPIALLSGHAWTLLPAMLFLPASAAINLAMGYAVGVKRVRYFSSINVAVTLVQIVLMAAGLFFVAREPRVAIAAWLISNILVAIAGVAAVLWHSRRLEGADPVSTREFVRFGIKVGFVNLVSLLNYRADLYIVALMATTAQLGMYTVAIAAAESLLVPTQVAALVTSPHIGSLDRDAAGRLAARCVRNNLLVALAVCGLLFVVADPIVHLLYGAAFLPVVPALRILLLGVFALSLGSPMSTYFTLKLGRPEVPLRLAGLSAVICIAVAIVLLPQLGIVGAAIGSTVAYVAGQAAAFWYFARTTRLSFASMVVPTRDDLALYRGFLSRLLQDGRRLLRPITTSR